MVVVPPYVLCCATIVAGVLCWRMHVTGTHTGETSNAMRKHSYAVLGLERVRIVGNIDVGFASGSQGFQRQHEDVWSKFMSLPEIETSVPTCIVELPRLCN